MSTIEPKGAVHWIDHYVVGTNDLPSWSYWALHATGLPIQPINGLTTNMRKKNTPIFCFMWWEGGFCRIGAFLQPENYPPAKRARTCPAAVFTSVPRTSTGTCAGSINTISRTDPVKTAADGERHGHLLRRSRRQPV
jgi:hypothetical protein